MFPMNFIRPNSFPPTRILRCSRPDAPWEGTGSGYVVDSLRSAFMLLEQTKSYEESVKRAVYLGNDTDTTACITGGLTGIFYGFSSIPERWISMLKERNRAEELFQKLLCSRETENVYLRQKS